MKIYYVYCVNNSEWYANEFEKAAAYHEPISVSTFDLVDNYCSVWTAATSLANLCGFFEFQFEKGLEMYGVKNPVKKLRKIVDDEKKTDDEKIDELNYLMREWAYVTWAEEGEEV